MPKTPPTVEVLRAADRIALTAYALALAAGFAAVIPLSFLGPELGALRNWQTGLNALLFVVVAQRAWRGSQAPLRIAPWALGALAFASALSLLVNQLFKFYAFAASGSDFPIFDRMLFETNHGRFMYAPTLELNHFGVHQTYVLFPLVLLHRLVETPLLLVVVNFVVLWLGVVPLWQLVREAWSEAAALLAGAAYLTNLWLIRVLDGGFRPEAFYPAATLWFLLGWRRERPAIWAPALIALLGIKEDAALTVIGFAVAVALFEPRRRRAAVAIATSALALMAFNLGVVQPHALAGAHAGSAAYGRFWGEYGRSFREIVFGMASSPVRVMSEIARSYWYRFFGPALFLPLFSGALLPMAPTLVLLGTSSHDMMWKYQWYYPLPMLAFLFWGLIEAHRAFPLLRRRPRARELLFLSALLLFPLVGGGYMRFPIPSLARLRALGALQKSMRQLPEVCAQEALAPHVPYDVRMHLLSAECLARPGAVAVVSPALDPYPFNEDDVRRWIRGAEQRGRIENFGAELYLVRGLSLDAR